MKTLHTNLLRKTKMNDSNTAAGLVADPRCKYGWVLRQGRGARDMESEEGYRLNGGSAVRNAEQGRLEYR